MKNVMVDLETFGSGSNSVIVSIGAVEFDATGVGNSFYMLVDPVDCQKRGMHIDASTVLWWLKQSGQARDALTAAESFELDVVLQEFSRFFKDSGAVYLWGNGATFDNVIMANAYKAVGRDAPWKFYNDRCYRTLKNLFKQVEQPPDIGTAHNALDDARWQALHAVEILKHIEGVK